MTILYKKTYLKAIENSVGSRLFNSLFVEGENGKSLDILKDGEFACAFFVSSILTLFEALDRPCTTVATLLDKLESDKSWVKIGKDEIQPGDLVFWEKVKFADGSENAHVGFAMGEEEAVSTDYKKKEVGRHPIYFRQIDAVYRYTPWS